jgi:hypothetical protein
VGRWRRGNELAARPIMHMQQYFFQAPIVAAIGYF